MTNHPCLRLCSAIVVGMFILAMVSPANSDAKIKTYQLGDVIEAQLGSWFMSIKQSDNTHFLSQGAKNTFTHLSGAVDSNNKASGPAPGVTNKDRLYFRLNCDSKLPIQLSLRYPVDVQTANSIRYRVKFNDDQLEGEGEKLANLQLVSEENKRLFGFHDFQIVNISDDALAIPAFLYSSSHKSMQIELLDNDKTYATGEFDIADFQQAFDFTCSTHPLYAQISKKSSKDKIQSPCDATAVEGECVRRKNYADLMLDKSAIEPEVDRLFQFLDQFYSSEVRQSSAAVRVIATNDQHLVNQVAKTLEAFIAKRNRDGVVTVLNYYDLHIEPDYRVGIVGPHYVSIQVRFGPKKSLLAKAVSAKDSLTIVMAIKNKNATKLKQILDQYDNKDDIFYSSGTVNSGVPTSPVGILQWSLKEGNAQTTRLLLEEAIDPETLWGRRYRYQYGEPLLKTALQHADVETVKVLLDTGSGLDFGKDRYYGKASGSMVTAVASGDTRKVDLLLEYGAELEARSKYNWTGLMHALWLKDKAMVEHLLPMSDPFDSSEHETIALTIFSGEKIDYLPALNALSLARRADGPDSNEFETMVLNRAKDTGKNAELDYLHIEAAIGEALLAHHEGNADAAIQALSKAIEQVPVLELSALSDGSILAGVMDALWFKHMLLLMEGQTMPEIDRQFIAHISSIGGWNQPLHDLLDVFHLASTSDDQSRLQAWVRVHGNPGDFSWEPRWVLDWVEQQQDPDTLRRLNALLEQFGLTQKTIFKRYY